MKKPFILTLLVLSAALGGCSFGTNNQNDNNNASTAVNNAASKQVEKNQSVSSSPETALTNSTSTAINATSTPNQKSEEEFNKSGRAKAIINETDMWKVYSDEKIGFSIKYPGNVRLAAKDEFIKDSESIVMKIETKNIGQMDLPWDLNKQEAQKNIEALAGGQYGVKYDEPVPASEKARTVGFLFAQDFVVLSRFDICNVTLERRLLFYFNNKSIVVTIYGPISKVRKLASDYFALDKANCGTDLRWDFNKKDAFYKMLADQKGPAELQEWFDTFDQIAKTIEFAHR